MLARADFACYTKAAVILLLLTQQPAFTAGCVPETYMSHEFDDGADVRSEERMNFNTTNTQNVKSERSGLSEKKPMQMICSGILRKDGEKIIYVRFERGEDFAEGSLPAAKITSHRGFSPDELVQFEEYMAENRFAIIEQAKSVNLMKNFMK